MSKAVKKTGIHMIYREGVPVAFFYRDEVSNENIIFVIQKASLEDIEELFGNDEKKI